MKRIIVSFFILGFFLVGCLDAGQGELTGIQSRKWHPEKPFGMSFIPEGSFILGKSNEENSRAGITNLKTVTVTSFYIDDTEITNSEYHQFVNWVKDSIVRTNLATLIEENYGSGGEEVEIPRELEPYAYKNADTTKLTVYQKYLLENYPEKFAKQLNWDREIIWNPRRMPPAHEYVGIIDSMYLPLEDSQNRYRMIDPKKLIYYYVWFDSDSATTAPRGSRRRDFMREERINVYPDTLVWVKDFDYSYNEPLHNEYFTHQAYSEYPVVGVTWGQANAFCAWRTNYKNSFQKEFNLNLVNDFRLPTEVEWEYAARGGLEGGKFPWGGPYPLSDTGCYLANFKPLRGNYTVDGGLYTMKSNSFEPNGYNLYNMSGNVAEWTSTAFFASSYNFFGDINPNTADGAQNRKVIRGGSWKDVSYFLEVGSRDYEYADSARSYIGFRTVQDYLGDIEN